MSSFKNNLYTIIFESDTKAGKYFDLALIMAIMLSVVVVMFDSVAAFHDRYGAFFYAIEWVLTGLFTIEYFLRVWTVKRPSKYVFSFFGMVDFISIVPTYISLFLAGAQYFMVIRLLRVLRIFRILKLVKYLHDARLLWNGIKASRRKITVFLFTVLSLVTILGSLMYLVEHGEHGFSNIPVSIYWAIVTLTTVGYGDISPHTSLGQTIASVIMLMGYSIIAVPLGLASVEISNALDQKVSMKVCRNCQKEGHDADAAFCKYCGHDMG